MGSRFGGSLVWQVASTRIRDVLAACQNLGDGYLAAAQYTGVLSYRKPE